MLKNVRLRPSFDRAILWGLAVIAGVTVWRLVLLPFATADLFVDELQYWQWGQALDWGYYSKPPLIGWVLRAVTDLSGSDSAFWIRMPGAVLHALTAVILMTVARRFCSNSAAAMVGVAYVTLPLVAVGSFLISTDTILLPFFAGAVGLYLRLVDRPSRGIAALMGAVIGLGMLAKYAAVYFWLGIGLGALMVPAYRIRMGDLLLAIIVFGVMISPNVIWNLQNDFVTLSHTADNVDWVRKPGMSLNFNNAAEFFGAQFIVMGPIMFAAFVWQSTTSILRPVNNARLRFLAWASLPIILLVTGQALLSRAYANWAAMAYVGAVLLVVPLLWTRARRWLWAAIALNLAISLAVPIAVTQANSWRVGDQQHLVLRRYVDRKELASRVLSVAQRLGVHDVVTGNRDALADLMHSATDTHVSIFAVPPNGHPEHYYAQTYPYPTGRQSPFVYVDIGDWTLPCDPIGDATPIERWTTPYTGYKGARVSLYLMPSTCFDAVQN
jgi:4-amino-4-deoxy-L-arabinose transferase-like glycosyltransferase